MKRLAGQLQDQPDFLERKTKFTIVLPLVRTYIYNPDYVTQSEVINAAIECLGAIAASHSFKDYRSMLIGKSIITVPAGFCDHPPSEGLRSLKPAQPLKQESGYSDQVFAKARV